MKWPLGRMETATLAGGLLIVATIDVVSYLSMTRLIAANDWLTHTYQILAKIEEIRSDLHAAEAAQRNYIVTGREAYFMVYRTALAELRRDLRDLRTLTQDNEAQQIRLDELEPTIEASAAELDGTLEVLRAQGFSAAQARIRSDRGEHLLEGVGESLNAMRRAEETLARERTVAAETRANATLTVLTAATALALLVVCLSIYRIARNVAKRRQAEASLREAKDMLDIRVEQRTAELALTNAELRGEIAERKQAEVALELLRRHNQLILDAAGEGIYGVDEHGAVTFANPAALRMLGWSADELRGQPAHRRLHHSRADGTPYPTDECPIDAAFHDGITRHVDDEAFWRKDGTPLQVEYVSTAIRDEEGRLIGAVVTFKDSTERRHAEEQIREQAALLDEARDAISVRDLDHRIRFWSKGAERVYGWTAAEAIGRDTPFLLKADPAQLEEARRTILEKGSWIGESRLVRKDGQPVLIEARWNLIRDSRGSPKAILVIGTDVTETKKVEAQLLRTQRLDSIGTLAGGIAHDLNNVLAPILMSIEILKRSTTDERSRRLFATLETSAQRGADMVKQILTFARGVEGERMLLQPRHLVKDIEKMAGETFPKTIKVHTKAASDLWSVSGDATQLHQVLLNLVVNARDAMPDGGVLTIAAANVELDGDYSRLNVDAKPGPYVMLSVTDTGTGIAPAVVEKIFEPFFTTKEVGKGTGLGLSTTHAIVKSHGGFVHVYSELGKGSVFKVYLPASRGMAEAAGPRAQAIPVGNGELILVVDDEASIREIAKETLESYGYRVILAADGTEAVALFAQWKKEVGAVVTDMRMPFMDGAATIRALRKIDPKVRIIAASGLGADGAEASADAGAIQALLHKPYTAEKLLKTLRQILAAG